MHVGDFSFAFFWEKMTGCTHTRQKGNRHCQLIGVDGFVCFPKTLTVRGPSNPRTLLSGPGSCLLLLPRVCGGGVGWLRRGLGGVFCFFSHDHYPDCPLTRPPNTTHMESSRLILHHSNAFCSEIGRGSRAPPKNPRLVVLQLSCLVLFL